MLVFLVNLHDHTQPIVRESCIGIMYGIRTVKIWWWQLIDHSWVSGCDPDPQVLELELCVVGRIMIDQWSMTTPQLHFLPKHNSNIIPIPDHWPRGNILRRTLTQNWPAIRQKRFPGNFPNWIKTHLHKNPLPLNNSLRNKFIYSLYRCTTEKTLHSIFIQF